MGIWPVHGMAVSMPYGYMLYDSIAVARSSCLWLYDYTAVMAVKAIWLCHGLAVYDYRAIWPCGYMDGYMIVWLCGHGIWRCAYINIGHETLV